MSTDRRKKYDDEMTKAATLVGIARSMKVISTIEEIRCDIRVPPLTLCAFLQDHAQLIREIYK